MNCTVITVTVTLIVEKKRFADLKNLILSDIIRHALMWYKSRVTNLTGVLLNEAHRNLKGPTGILGVTLAVSGMCRKGEMLQLMHTCTHILVMSTGLWLYIPPPKNRGFPTHHDYRGVCWKLLGVSCGGVCHSAGKLLVTQFIHAVWKALHLADRQQHSGVFGLHCQHLALGVERGDLLLVATDLLG